MVKKCVFFSLAALVISSAAQAIELPEGATPSFFKSSTAYCSTYFNRIMEAHGQKLDLTSGKAVNLPPSYAKNVDGKPSFNKVPTAYTPMQYHDIFTSYGLVLSKQHVADDLTVDSYAKVVGDDIVFGKKSIAYGGAEWQNILSVYTVPMAPKPVMAKPMKKPMPVKKMMDKDSDGDGVMDKMDNCPNTPKGATVNEKGCWVLPSNVLFDFNKATLKEEFYPELNKVKKVFDQNPDLEVVIEGHTDSKGSEAYNQKLSERRANAVRDYFTDKLFISPQRLQTVGYGESNPAYTNDTETGRALNRRVELTPVQ